LGDRTKNLEVLERFACAILLLTAVILPPTHHETDV
jgi:hypothetical protein